MKNDPSMFEHWKDAYKHAHTEDALRSQTSYVNPSRNFPCPFHLEQSGASMKYNSDTQTMYCFGKCGRLFNVFDLLALRDGINPNDSAAVRQNVIYPLWASYSRGEDVPVHFMPKSTIAPHLIQKKLDPMPAPEYNPDTPPPDLLQGFGKPTTIFRYTQSFYVYRKDFVQANGKQDKDIRPVHWTPQTEWKIGDPHGLLPLYGIDRIRENPRLPVLIVEGEKAAEAARLFVNGEYSVITWAHGANSVHRTDWKPLYGRRVLIWPDNDEPGINAAINIGSQLLQNACDVLIIEPTGDKKSDAADFLSRTYSNNHIDAYDGLKWHIRECKTQLNEE